MATASLQQQFEASLPEWRNRLAAHVGRQIRQPADADDTQEIVQEALIHALRNLDSLRDAGRLSAWLRAIALNEIRKWSARRRTQEWVRQVDVVESAGTEPEGEWLESFNRAVSRLAQVEMAPELAVTMALHVCLGWTPKEIAAVTGTRLNTVHSRIQRVLPRMHGGDAELRSPRDITLKRALSIILWNAGVRPVSGPVFRNRELLDFSLALARLAALQYPDDVSINGWLTMTAYMMAQLAEYAGDDAPPVYRRAAWRRDRWDRGLLARADSYRERFLRLRPAEYFLATIEAAHLTFAPERHADVDWRGVADWQRRILRAAPSCSAHCRLAWSLLELDGAAAAARYLDEQMAVRTLRDYPLAYLELGLLRFEAGQWLGARRALRKYLQWQASSAMQAWVREWIRQAEQRMPRSPKK